ncbi:hypothetical protein [Paraburkholderia sp. BCC1886]|uniref:hypothetical protein n=1 Tax=Paraburkholderia sp. BCC1886 TaxID=2562670 RepID=UPI001183045C|nr:hypothetical protein [Paraburkholderia sp. BCC1886]
MTTPTSIILAAVDEVSILDTWLGHFDHNEKRLDTILEALFLRLRKRADAMTALQAYLVHLHDHSFPVNQMDLIGPTISNLYRELYRQLIETGAYHPKRGVLPYRYRGRIGTRVLILGDARIPRGWEA